MKFRFGIVFVITSFPVVGICDDPEGAKLPISIWSVETFRVEDSILRVTTHFPDFERYIDLDLIRTPDFVVEDSMAVRSVELDGETLIFEESAAMEYDGFAIHGTRLSFHLGYVVPRPSEWIDMTCTVSIANERLQAPKCVRWKEE